MNDDDIKENDVVYRCIGDDFDQGILSCGFMRKRTVEHSHMTLRSDITAVF